MEDVDESEEKKFSKYNQIYDRIRKKRDELECLTVQRIFLAFIHDILNGKDFQKSFST